MIRAVYRAHTYSVRMAKDAFLYQKFFKPNFPAICHGIFATYKEASASIPQSCLTGFENEVAPKVLQDHFMIWHQQDYPVALWLSRIIQANDTVFDYGGGLGRCYYAYRKYVPYPEGLHWQVCDLETMMKQGASLAEKRGATTLSFTPEFSRSSECNILISCGTLQYIEEDMVANLAKQTRKPRHVLINNIPMHDGAEYFTVQSSTHSLNPYRIFDRQKFISGFEKIGYELVDIWHCNREEHILFHPEKKGPFMGLYFKLIA